MLALAEELASREGTHLVLFLSRKTPSVELPPDCRAVFLKLSGFSRRPDARNLKAAAQLLSAFRICRRMMRKERPQIAVGFGGYASVPGLLAAWTLGVPLLLHEQNVVPGTANRLLAPLARAIAVSFPETLALIPRWERKAVVTGNPLLSRGKGKGDPHAFFGLQPGRKTVVVMGGSQGAATLNRAVLEALRRWSGREDLQVVHAVGRDKYQEFAEEAAKVDYSGLIYRSLDFVERMDLLYRVADLVVCRAGASTVSELAAAGRGAILVPYPYATASHQEANAEVLRKAGAAVVVPDREMNGERLCREVDEILKDEERVKAMGEAARRVARPQAARRLADLVLKVAEEA